MTPEQERDPALRRSRYNHYRLPLIQTLLRCVYALEMLTVLRVWNVRRVLSQVLSGRGGKFRLLDLGCGLGDYIFLYAGTYPDALFLGVDAVEENVHLCRAYQHLRGLRNVAFVHDDLGRFVPDEKVDVVLCITVLQYVDDVSSALKNAHNALGEGGLLVLYQDVYDSVLGGPASSYPAHRMTSELQHTYSSTEVLKQIVSAGFHIDAAHFCQGVWAGRVEAILKSFLNAAKRHPVFGLLLLPLALSLYPFYLAVLWLDIRATHNAGEGLLVVARTDAGRGDCLES